MACARCGRRRPGQASQPAVADELLVDTAEATGEGRVHGGAQHDGFAIHRPAGRDDQVGARHQALTVQRLVGHDDPVQRHLADALALRHGARQHDGHHTLGGREALQHAREHVVLEPVVERQLRRRAQDREQLPVRREAVRDRRVGLEGGERVLLLQARVPDEPRAVRAVAREALRRDRLRHQRAAGEPAVERVLQDGVLVVEHRRRRDAQQPGDDRLVGRAVRQGRVEGTAARPPVQRRDPAGRGLRLAGPPAAAVVAGDHRVEPVQARDRDRLPVVAGGHLDGVAARLERTDERRQHDGVRRVREVDPDPHAVARADATAATTSRC